MNILTEDQILERWDTLPETLKDPLVSPVTSELIEKLCQDQKLSDDGLSVVLDATADVLMGFSRPDDVGRELVEQLNLDPKVAATIQESLKAKIFAPLRQVLDATYKPVGGAEIKSSIVPNPNGPKMFDVATPATGTKPGSPTSAVPLPKPDLSAKGWSGMRPAMPPVPIANIPKPAQAIMQPQQRPTTVPQPSRVPAATPVPTPVTPAPLILEQSAQFTAPQKNSNFRLPTNTGGAQVELGGGKPQEAKTMPAFIEFSQKAPGASPASASTPVIKMTPTPQGAIHYTDFGKAPTPMPAANSGPRKIDEVTSSPVVAAAKVSPAPMSTPAAVSVPVPKPPTPAAMAATPPVPTAAPQPPVKVITKDFL